MSRAVVVFLTATNICIASITVQRCSGQEVYSDTLRAIIVFAKFADDQTRGDPAVNFREWPVSLQTIPDFGKRILARTPSGPFPDSSLTAYYNVQSQGNFLIWGEAFPRIYTTKEREQAYHRPDGGYGKLTLEILQYLDTNGYDFRDYDYNSDGQLDYLFIILRSDSERDAKKMTWTGISCLDARCGGGLSAGTFIPAPELDGIKVDWNTSGSILFNRTPGNVSSFWYHVRLMAHELGHDLWQRYFVHIPALRSNDVPFVSNRDPKYSCIGYVLMAGAGGAPDCSGDYTISAFERELHGWITCDTVDVNRFTILEIGDLYTTSDCYKIPSQPGNSFLYLSNRQRIGPFDVRKRGGSHGQFDLGLLRTTGLLVMKSSGVQLDVLPADNSLDLSAQSLDYAGDLFQDNTQLTPFTRPNINGYTLYRGNSEPLWYALDNIRNDADSDYLMSVDFVPDFRTDPDIRSDSWIGPEPDSVNFTGLMTVLNSATLTIDRANVSTGDIRVRRGSTLHVKEGSILTLNGCSLLRLDRGARLVNEGVIIVGRGIFSVAGSSFNLSGRLSIDSGCHSD
ncbi:MAG: hypothetical protein HKN43_04285 [Rhodothermales bacterium]|nr:hypothetical protein [Rhodothermales bacterium]